MEHERTLSLPASAPGWPQFVIKVMRSFPLTVIHLLLTLLGLLSIPLVPTNHILKIHHHRRSIKLRALLDLQMHRVLGVVVLHVVDAGELGEDGDLVATLLTVSGSHWKMIFRRWFIGRRGSLEDVVYWRGVGGGLTQREGSMMEPAEMERM